MELSLSSQFNIFIPIDNGLFVESHENLTYTFTYPNHYMGWIVLYTLPKQPQIRMMCFVLSLFCILASNKYLIQNWKMLMTNRISRAWIFYIAYFYQNLRVFNSINLYQGLASLAHVYQDLG